jgi:hypothetical protein
MKAAVTTGAIREIVVQEVSPSSIFTTRIQGIFRTQTREVYRWQT